MRAVFPKTTWTTRNGTCGLSACMACSALDLMQAAASLEMGTRFANPAAGLVRLLGSLDPDRCPSTACWRPGRRRGAGRAGDYSLEEYFKSVKPAKPKGICSLIGFEVGEGGRYKIISFAKRARA